MASGSATRIYDSRITTGGTAETVTLAAIYPTVVVENRGSTAMYVTTGTDTNPPTAATVGGEDEAVVAPNTSAVIPVHYQRKGRVWVNGTLQWVDGSDTSTVYQHTVVSVASATATAEYTVAGNI